MFTWQTNHRPPVLTALFRSSLGRSTPSVSHFSCLLVLFPFGSLLLHHPVVFLPGSYFSSFLCLVYPLSLLRCLNHHTFAFINVSSNSKLRISDLLPCFEDGDNFSKLPVLSNFDNITAKTMDNTDFCPVLTASTLQSEPIFHSDCTTYHSFKYFWGAVNFRQYPHSCLEIFNSINRILCPSCFTLLHIFLGTYTITTCRCKVNS